MQLGYFHVIADPVSTCVHEIFEFSPSALAALGDEVVDPALARPCRPGYQFWTVEYLICALSERDQLDHGGMSWFSSRIGAVQPSR